MRILLTSANGYLRPDVRAERWRLFIEGCATGAPVTAARGTADFALSPMK